MADSERQEKNGSGWTEKNRNRLIGMCAGCGGSGGIIETESCSYALSIGEKIPIINITNFLPTNNAIAY